ncbi:hypothetical protein Tco_1461739, partial [Tanacetum coccineum]
LILGRSFLRTGRALINVYEGELILRDVDERLIFHVEKHPQKHAKESIKMINFIVDSFGEVLRLKKSNHFSSGSTTPFFDSYPNFTSFKTSDSLLEEFADELAFLDPFPPGNKDVDVEAELREIESLFNRDPSTNFSPRITFDPNPKSNDESSHEEVTHEMSFITYSNPLFDLNEEIISSEFNPIHIKVLDSIPKNDNFDAKSYLPESPLNHNTLTVLPPRNDFLHHEFASEIITNPSRITREHEEYINDYDSEDDENSTFDEPVLLHTPFPDEDECFDPGGDNDEIDAFLAIEVPTYIEEGYYDSEGDVLYLERLLIDDTTHNLFSEGMRTPFLTPASPLRAGDISSGWNFHVL